MDVQKRAHEIADKVIGTCDCLSEEDDSDLMNVPGLAETFDDLAWCCECCGWWVHTHDTEHGVCSDCQDRNDE